MNTISKVFLDSSVLVEALKGNKVNFYHSIISEINNECCINSTVISEYLYFLLGYSSGVSPRALKESKKLPEILFNESNQVEIINEFTFLEDTKDLVVFVPKFMQQYNMLPNDAIILATCKINNITRLASHDTDFIIPCQLEKIELLIEKD